MLQKLRTPKKSSRDATRASATVVKVAEQFICSNVFIIYSSELFDTIGSSGKAAMLNGGSKISLDDLAINPALAADLAPRTVASLLGLARIATSALEARLLVASIQGQKPTSTNPETLPARLMTAAEVAERLGFKPGYVYELARAGKIKSRKQGKYVRFTEAALSEYVANNDSSVDTMLSNVLSVVREPQTVQKRSPRDRFHTDGTGTPLGRARDDGQPVGARIREDS